MKIEVLMYFLNGFQYYQKIERKKSSNWKTLRGEKSCETSNNVNGNISNAPCTNVFFLGLDAWKKFLGWDLLLFWLYRLSGQKTEHYWWQWQV